MDKSDSVQQRLERWLDNERIDWQRCCVAWGRWVLSHYSGQAQTSCDATCEYPRVRSLVSLPLYEAGQRVMLVRKTRSAGGINLFSVDLDVDAWTRLITGGLEQGIIRLS